MEPGVRETEPAERLHAADTGSTASQEHVVGFGRVHTVLSATVVTYAVQDAVRPLTGFA